MGMKLAPINVCENCPFFDYDDQYSDENWGWCDKVERNIDRDTSQDSIPEWCELEDYHG